MSLNVPSLGLSRRGELFVELCGCARRLEGIEIRFLYILVSTKHGLVVLFPLVSVCERGRGE